MPNPYRLRRFVTVCLSLIILVIILVVNSQSATPQPTQKPISTQNQDASSAADVLQLLPVKGRAPKTNYSREQFGAGWITTRGCDMRNIILNRDLVSVSVDDICNVINGTLNDPYTGKVIEFKRGSSTSAEVQIDHVVALSDAWQKGAQLLTREQRIALANDPLELLAVDGSANQQKSDGDAATWLPPYKLFRCQYVARQVAVKQKYSLWLTQSEKSAISSILAGCPGQTLPVE